MPVQNGSFFTKIYSKEKKGIIIVKVDVETWPTHATYDNGVACIFRQGSRSYVQDMNIVMANLHYVSMLKEIIVVSYIGQRVTLMKCSWIHAHM
jgi:hypothetical protein